jgi:hypothetical protein
MRSFALVLLACTGCDLLFDIHSIPVVAGDGGGDSRNNDADLGPPHCSPITMLADDFHVDDLSTMWPGTTTLSANVIEVSGGQALIENYSADSYATLDAGRYFDLREHYLSVRITDNGAMDMADFVSLGLDSEVAGFAATFTRNNATMTFTEFTPTRELPIVSFTYDANDDEYLRVGVIGGALVFETSPNAVSWTRQATITDGSGFTFVHPSIQAHRGISSPEFTVYVDDVDGGTPSGAACPIARLHDDFSGALLGEEWARSEMYGGTLTLVGGIVDAQTTGVASKVSLGPSTVYDLSNGAISVEIPQIIADATDNRVTLMVVSGIGDSTEMTENNGTLSANAQLSTSSAPMVLLPYDPVQMRWWRIANRPAGMTWEVSPDGASWMALDAPFPMGGIDRCDISIVVESASGVVGHTQFDNVDLP